MLLAAGGRCTDDADGRTAGSVAVEHDVGRRVRERAGNTPRPPRGHPGERLTSTAMTDAVCAHAGNLDRAGPRTLVRQSRLPGSDSRFGVGIQEATLRVNVRWVTPLGEDTASMS
jgi:hypothetical protein